MEPDAAFVQCAEQVRTNDADRYLTALMVEPDLRGPLMGLYAFYNELANIRDRLHEPQMALIRLQWWRDSLESLEEDTPGEPILIALKAALQTTQLRYDGLQKLIDSFEADLYGPMIRTWEELDAYCDTTSGTLMELALGVLGAADREISELGGRAWGLSGLVRAFPHHAGAGRIYLPAEAFGEVDLDPHLVLQGEGGPPMMAILLATLGRAQDYAALMRQEAKRLPKIARPAVSYVSLIDLYVAQVRRRPNAPFALHPDIPSFRKQWRLMTTSLLR